MTNEEAIIDIRENIQPIIGGKSLDIAISAIEKQIPKVVEHKDGVWSICPCCRGSVCNDTEHGVNREVSYCEHCGQAIDWENSEFD